MPKLHLKVDMKKFTTRDGKGQNDGIYFEQQRNQIEEILKRMGYNGEVTLEVEPASGEKGG